MWKQNFTPELVVSRLSKFMNRLSKIFRRLSRWSS